MRTASARRQARWALR
ncbi:hypothetical protein ACSTIM_23505, partial [Vibrio parahaemolyticus]